MALSTVITPYWNEDPLCPRSIVIGLNGGCQGLVYTTEENAGENHLAHSCCLVSAQDTWPIVRTKRGAGGARKKRKWIFKKYKLPSPITPNWTNEVSLGPRLCHIKSYLGMLQTYHNYLMDSGLRQS